MVRATLVDLNCVELKFFPFMISLDKCNGSCNVLSPKICIPKKTKHINVKVFNMKFIIQHTGQNKKVLTY